MAWYLSHSLLLLYIPQMCDWPSFGAFQRNLVCENQSTGCGDTSWMKFVIEEMKKEERKVEDKEVILIKPYVISTTTFSSSSLQTSFIMDKVKNLLKYMKFVWSPIQTRLFKPPPYYQSLKFRGEQDTAFWKEVATGLVDQKHNIETARNGSQIPMFQGGPLHEPYFIAINNREQIIIGPSMKIVAIYVVGELKVLI